MAQDQKQEAIIEAAIKRFAHFGVTKTTMTEIASDLALSKASLYYYFPDKLNLYAAVFKTITSAGEKTDDEELAKEKDPYKAIFSFLQKRTEFIIRYYNILEFLKDFNANKIPPELEPIFSYLRKRELKRVTCIIEKGVQSKVFKITDVKKTAELFFDALDGLRTISLKTRSNFFPDKKQFQQLLKKETEFAAIFFNGLTLKAH